MQSTNSFFRGLKQLKSTCGPHAMVYRFIIKREKYYAPNWFNCLIVCLFWRKSGKCEILAIMKRKGSNYIGNLSDRGKLQLLQTSVHIL